jgi:hypothetical protein
MEPSPGRLGSVLRAAAILLVALDVSLLVWLMGTHRFSAGTTLLIVNGIAVTFRLVRLYVMSARRGSGGPGNLI